MSYELDWVAPGKPFPLNDSQHNFKGEFVATQARMGWSAHRADGFRFVSDPADTSTSVFDETGRVRNGAFFTKPPDD